MDCSKDETGLGSGEMCIEENGGEGGRIWKEREIEASETGRKKRVLGTS